MTPALSIDNLTDSQLFRYLSDAFKHYHSALLLSRSPLADSTLVTPTLVRDEVSPTADERGNGLRLILQWAVDRLAPGPIKYPTGTLRPYDDPTWMEPAWWRYNILRHRYIEPLHPDEFVEGGRFTETLMALTGIPSQDAFFDERNRAIRDVGQWLRGQAADGAATAMIRQQALETACRPLEALPDARHVLDVASAFSGLFPRHLLVEIAGSEGIVDANNAIDRLVAERLLLRGDDGTSLWLSPALRTYVYRRQEKDRRRIRHRNIGTFYVDAGEPLTAAYHLRQAGEVQRAATLLLGTAQELIAELASDELREALLQFDRDRLNPQTWCEIQLLLCDLYLNTGRHDDALAAARAAITVATDDLSRGRIFRRMGKVYEQRNQLHALTYYGQAGDYFSSATLTDDPADSPAFGPGIRSEHVEMLKDRAWVHIERRQWAEAEADLRQALSLTSRQPETEARIYDALASLYRYQEAYDRALEHARRALILREEAGDPFGIAKSLSNLGLLYAAMGDTVNAVAAHAEALAAFERLANGEHMAAALLNMGTAYHFGGELENAIDAYQRSLKLCQEGGWTLTESRSHSNLVEAWADLGDIAQASDHWRQGYRLSQDAGLDDELAYYRELQARYQALGLSGEGRWAEDGAAQETDRSRSAVDAYSARVVTAAGHRDRRGRAPRSRSGAGHGHGRAEWPHHHSRADGERWHQQSHSHTKAGRAGHSRSIAATRQGTRYLLYPGISPI